MLTDLAAVGLAGAFVYGLSRMNPVHNEGKLREMMDIGKKPSTANSGANGEPHGLVKGVMAPVEGIRNRTPLSSCGLPQGVGISTRLLPPKDGEKFDDSEFLALDAQGLVSKNFLSATARLGMPANTSNRVKSHQLRSEPTVERSINVGNTPFYVSPHMGTELQRPFELQHLSNAEFMEYRKTLQKGGVMDLLHKQKQKEAGKV